MVPKVKNNLNFLAWELLALQVKGETLVRCHHDIKLMMSFKNGKLI